MGLNFELHNWIDEMISLKLKNSKLLAYDVKRALKRATFEKSIARGAWALWRAMGLGSAVEQLFEDTIAWHDIVQDAAEHDARAV